MKITIEQLRRLVSEGVGQALLEAKRKKKAKAKEPGPLDLEPGPAGYVDGGPMQFHAPLGDRNLYKDQGRSTFGPYTSEGIKRLIAKHVREQLRPVRGKKTGR